MSGLVPCKFFSRGHCRYGDNCKFYHNRNDGGGNNMGGNYNFNQGSILSPSNFRPQQQHQQQHQSQPQQNYRQQLPYSAKTMETLAQIEDATIKDMKEWELSKMWPLSVYAPVSLKACLPGFEDLSPEELRWSWLQNGRQPPADLFQRLQRVNELRALYVQTNNTNTRAMLERLIKGATTEQLSAEFNMGSTSQWGSNAPNSATVFGVPNQNIQQSMSGFTNFNNAMTPNPTNAGNLWPQQQSSFPAAPTNQINPQGWGMNKSVGDTMESTEMSAFNPMNNSMQSQPQTQQQPTQSIFNPTPTANPMSFLSQMGQKSLFEDSGNSNANAGISSGMPFMSNTFAGVQQPSAAGGSIFAPQNAPSGFNQQLQQTPVGKFVYSDESELTEEEKATFLAPTFDVIPLKPPPQSYCF